MNVLPSYRELKSYLPLHKDDQAFITESRQTIRAILHGKDSRLLLIVGPCSIHDPLSAKEYADKLKKLASTVSDNFFIVMRNYCEKARTNVGWKGYLYDPHLNESHDIRTGIHQTRHLFLALTQLRIPIATEFLDPLTSFYYDDLISWGSIGARTSSSQPHRYLASQLDMPIGIKNGTAGNISAAINGVIAALHPHSYVGLNDMGQPTIIHSTGNKDAHIVLRGGDKGPNFDPLSINETLLHLKKASCPASILVDCSHQNSGKRYDKQPFVFQSVIDQVLDGNTHIRGLLLESHLKAGSQSLTQNPSDLQYGVSITDGCLDWSSTEELILRSTDCLVESKRKNSHNTKRESSLVVNDL